MPEVAPVFAARTSEDGLRVDVAPGLVPPGGRRASLTSHEFWPRMVGQEQRIQTGWLAAGETDLVSYSPHTKSGYRLPRSKLVYDVGCATIASGMRGARRAGLATEAAT